MGKGTPCGGCPKPVLCPSNHAVWDIFQHLSSQGRWGAMGGLTGVDYASLPVLFEAYGVVKAEWPFYLDKIRLLVEIAMKYCNSNKATA